MEAKPTFQIKNIVLMESSFKRDLILDERYSKSSLSLNVNTHKIAPVNDEFAVYLTITFKQEFEEIVLLESKTTMAGVFKKSEVVTDEQFNNFCDINAPAIIFPFVREIIASQTAKAGVQPVVIQPINFVELAQSKAPRKTAK